MRTAANADLAHGYERVVIVAQVASGVGFMVTPRRQAAALTAAGARVALVRPDRATVRAIERNVLDASRRGGDGSAGRPGRLAGLTRASGRRPDDDPGDPTPAVADAVTRRPVAAQNAQLGVAPPSMPGDRSATHIGYARSVQ